MHHLYCFAPVVCASAIAIWKYYLECLRVFLIFTFLALIQQKLSKRTNHLTFAYLKLLVWVSVLVDFVSSFTALIQSDSQA
jgi:hypothetical protein